MVLLSQDVLYAFAELVQRSPACTDRLKEIGASRKLKQLAISEQVHSFSPLREGAVRVLRHLQPSFGDDADSETEAKLVCILLQMSKPPKFSDFSEHCQRDALRLLAKATKPRGVAVKATEAIYQLTGFVKMETDPEMRDLAAVALIHLVGERFVDNSRAVGALIALLATDLDVSAEVSDRNGPVRVRLHALKALSKITRFIVHQDASVQRMGALRVLIEHLGRPLTSPKEASLIRHALCAYAARGPQQNALTVVKQGGVPVLVAVATAPAAAAAPGPAPGPAAAAAEVPSWEARRAAIDGLEAILEALESMGDEDEATSNMRATVQQALDSVPDPPQFPGKLHPEPKSEMGEAMVT